MKIAVISDLHIKTKDSSSFFEMDDYAFSLFLLELSQQVDRIYLDGDILELFKTRRLSKKSVENEISGIFSEYPNTMQGILQNPQVRFIIGNHDSFLSTQMNHPIWKNKLYLRDEITNSNGEILVIWHGNLDIFNHTLPFVGHVASFLSGWVERGLHKFKMRGAYLWLRGKIRKSTFRNSTQLNSFKKEIKSNDRICCMINGHTHLNEVTRFDYNDKPRLYINSGKFDGATRDITILDTETLEVLKSTSREKNFFKVKEVLKRGDIILSRNKENHFSQFIAEVSGGPYSHSMLYVGNNRVIESTIGDINGVQISLIDKYLDGAHELAVLSLKDTTKIEGVVSSFYSMLGMKYATLQLFVIGVYLFFKRVLKLNINAQLDISSNRVVCSEALAKALTDNGYDYPPTTSPNDFIDREDFDIKLITLNS